MAITIYVTLAVCAGLAGLLVYRYDLYDREPWFMVVIAAGAGYALMALMGVIEPWSVERLSGAAPTMLAYAAVAATHEELARLLVVVALALLVPRFFNDPMDGLIYGSIVGLGMAVEESTFFLSLAPPDGHVLPPSELVRLSGHLLMGGITGFGVGMLRMGRPGWRRVLAGCVAVSMTIHFLWDWIAFAALADGAMHWWRTAAAVTLMLGGVLFYGMLVTVASDWSRHVFEPHSAKSLWGWPLTLVVGRGTKGLRDEGTQGLREATKRRSDGVAERRSDGATE